MAIETPARIAVLGAGPIGLETALYGRYLGYDVDVYERASVAANVLRWGHVRMFSPFGMNRSSLAVAALRAQDSSWQPPADDERLKGRQFAERYLLPLARCDLLVDGLHEHTQVEAIGRVGLLKGERVGDEDRADGQFRLLLRSTKPGDHGRQRFATADVVIDTTGTYGNHNWLGPDGVGALGELAAEPHIEYGLPDVLGAEHDHYAGRNVLLVGDGDSAATNLVALAELAAMAPDTWITWVTRRACDEKSPQPVVPVADERLPQRERLARAANALAADDSNHITFYSGTTVAEVSWHADLRRFVVRLAGKHATEMECDQIIANVGYRPDAQIYRELQVSECYATGAPAGLAKARAKRKDGNDPHASGSCGPQSLVTPEPDFYVLGAKSFGRDSRFLIHVGLDQVRDLFTILGDRANLDLYATMPD